MNRIVKRRDNVPGEIDNIAARIAKDNPDAAARFVRAVHATYDFLAEHSGLGTEPEWLPPYRYLLRGDDNQILKYGVIAFPNWNIYFYEIPNGIYVIHIRHGARHLTKAA